jgi:hypothetical protein
LEELARIAFPNGSVTADTLKRRARQGKLAVYRPGKVYISTLVDIKAFLEASRVEPKSKPPAPVSDWRAALRLRQIRSGGVRQRSRMPA